jgi:hypothetical protein
MQALFRYLPNRGSSFRPHFDFFSCVTHNYREKLGGFPHKKVRAVGNGLRPGTIKEVSWGPAKNLSEGPVRGH